MTRTFRGNTYFGEGFQRLRAALSAICFRFLADSFFARANPPLLAPSLLSA